MIANMNGPGARRLFPLVKPVTGSGRSIVTFWKLLPVLFRRKVTILRPDPVMEKLGPMAPKFFYDGGRLVVEDAGKFSGSIVDFLKLRITGSWRMGELFNDIVPRNIGA